jgi:hypothetical protein
MKSIESRIKKIEDQLQINRQTGVIVIFDKQNPEEKSLPKDLTQWIIYKEQYQKGNNLILLSACEELQAIQRIQNTTETDNLSKNPA